MAGSENNAGNKVKAISPLAQWRVKSLGVHDYRRSDGFMIGSWNWCLSVENNNSILSIRLISKPSCITEDKYPIAKILIRAHCTGSTNSHYAECKSPLSLAFLHYIKLPGTTQTGSSSMKSTSISCGATQQLLF
ncbi:BTB/POZ domain-containing protein At1g21780-like [Zingiber officinale]|uniref:BTB/POZ domain-containing protein At1g21780-like n=1 Tax=Zingiber officinale TaxID=94328 RepID=UPI001C4D33A2|nr:BTB/POZ domain-containing protein At1g21780-like [Zingiber officinale]